MKRFNFTLKKRFFQHQYQKQVKMFALFHDRFPMKFIFIHIKYFLGMVRNTEK